MSGAYAALGRGFEEDDGDGVGLLSGRAAGNPDADRLLLRFQKDGNHDTAQGVERFDIAEEGRDGDEQVGEERGDFLDVLAEIDEIVGEFCDTAELHPPGQSAHDGGALVAREVVSGARAQIAQDGYDGVFGGGDARLFQLLLVARQFFQPLGEFAHRQDDVGKARGDGAARHGAEFGLGRFLDEDDAAAFLHRLEADRSVRPAA